MPILGIVLLLSGSAMATAAVFVVARLVPVARRKAHNDILGYVYAETGVIYAVVLAMVVVGVWETRSQAHGNTYTETDALLQLTEQQDDPAAWRQFTEIRSLVNTQEPATGADQVRYQGALEAIGFVHLFGVESPRAHAGVVFSPTFIVGVMLLIVYEFDYPFSGPLKVNPTAFRLALERMRSIN